jgi:hypothetical protein
VGTLPLKRVRVKESGHVCHINASDFNADLHEDLTQDAPREQAEDAPAEPRPESKPEKRRGRK